MNTEIIDCKKLILQSLKNVQTLKQLLFVYDIILLFESKFEKREPEEYWPHVKEILELFLQVQTQIATGHSRHFILKDPIASTSTKNKTSWFSKLFPAWFAALS